MGSITAPVTWNNELPSEVDTGVAAHTTNTDFGHAGETNIRTGQELAGAAYGIGEQLRQAEDRANRAIGLSAATDYERSLNDLVSKYTKEAKGIDAVAQQASLSDQVYAMREQMGASLPNKGAQQHFLDRTADPAVRNDRLIQFHAADQHQRWESGLLDANVAQSISSLVRAVSTDPYDRTGFTAATLETLANYGSERSAFTGNSSPEAIHLARNESVAGGVAIALQQMVADHNAGAIIALEKRIKGQEGGDGVMASLETKHGEVYKSAKAFVQQEFNDLNIKSAQSVPMTYVKTVKGPNGVETKKTIAIPGMFNLAAAFSKVDQDFAQQRKDKDGNLLVATATDLIHQKEGLVRAYGVAQQGYQSEVSRRVNALYAAVDDNIGSGMPSGAATRDAIEHAGRDAWRWISDYSPSFARQVLAQLATEERQDLHAPKTDEQRNAFAEKYAELSKPGRAATISAEEFAVMIRPLHPDDKDRLTAFRISEIKRAQSGDPPAKTYTVAMTAAMEGFKELFPSPQRQTWKAENIVRFDRAWDSLLGWISDQTREDGTPPGEAEVALRMKLYLTPVSLPGSVTTWNNAVPLGQAIQGSEGTISAPRPERTLLLPAWNSTSQYESLKNALRKQVVSRYKLLHEAQLKKLASTGGDRAVEAEVERYWAEYWNAATTKRPTGKYGATVNPSGGVGSSMGWDGGFTFDGSTSPTTVGYPPPMPGDSTGGYDPNGN